MTTIKASQSGISVSIETLAPTIRVAQSGVSVATDWPDPAIKTSQAGVSIGVETQAPQIQTSQAGATVILYLATRATITPDSENTYIAGENQTFTATLTGATALTYTWSTSGLVSGQGTATAVYNWTQPGSYTITVSITHLGGIGSAANTSTLSMCSPMIATREAAIRAVLKGLLSGVTNIGNVDDYVRWSVLYPDARAQTQTAVGGRDLIRAWMLTCVSVTAEPLAFRAIGTNNGIAYTYTYKIRGFLGLNDTNATEKDAIALAMQVIAALHTSDTLHDGQTYHNASWATLDTLEPRMFQNFLAHYVEITQTVTEVINCVSYTTTLPTWSAGSSALDEATIRTGLTSVVAAIPDIGTTADYIRWAVLYPDMRAQHQATISATTLLRSWMVTCTNVTSELLAFRRPGATTGMAYTYTYKIRGVVGLNDADITEKSALALALSVVEALHRSITLNDGQTYLDAGLASLDVFEPRMFQNFLAHYVEITQTIRTVQA